MKVKQSPADFRVEELTNRRREAIGEFALYRLEKSGWTTPDAVAAISRHWRLDRLRVSFGGLKDRHAVTTQCLTINGGPEQNLRLERLTLTFLGRTDRPFTSADIAANRFAITLRSLSHAEAERAVATAPEVVRAGLPNYFDEQRFGSIGSGGEFVGRELVRGNFETALKLGLAAPYEFDRPETRRIKATLLKHWGDWRACRRVLPRDLGTFLVRRPTDFRGAVQILDPELQGLHLAAYQSALWNRTLARCLWELFPAESLGTVQIKRDVVPVPWRGSERFDDLVIPLPSARMQPVPEAAWWPALSSVLDEEGLTLNRLRVPGVRKPFFSKGERTACVRPEGLSVEPDEDERFPGRRKLLLRFDLPRGAYATMVIKRLATFRPPVS